MSASSSLFACPQCRGPLRRKEHAVECTACAASYPVVDGVIYFYSGESSHGELSDAEMATLAAAARKSGWVDALMHALPRGKEFVRDLITDPRRRGSLDLLEGVGGRVLDYGCGYGGVSRFLSETFDEVVSIDASRQRVSFFEIIRAQDELHNISIACHNDVEDLPFRDNSLDAVVMVGVLEYFPQSFPQEPADAAQIKSLASFLRVLKPGGYLLIQTKNRFGWQYFLGARDNSGLRFAPVLPTWFVDFLLRMSGRGGYRIISRSFMGYCRLLASAGFTPTRTLWPVPSYQFPDFSVDLNAAKSEQLESIPRGYFSGSKAAMIRLMIHLGILRYVAPYYSILARKPDSAVDPRKRSGAP